MGKVNRKAKQFVGIKAVGFDVDGTLYHAPPEMSTAVSKLLIAEAAEALSQDSDELTEEFLRRREEYRSSTLTLNSFGLDGEAIFQKIWDTIAIEKYVAKDTRLLGVMAELKQKYRLFIISNGTGRQVERMLTHLGLNYRDFDPRIYCYDQGWVKPEPAPFLSVIESLELTPEEIVYVGDRENVDVVGAQAVGMKAVYVGGMSEMADATVESVYDIVSIL